MTRLDLEEVVGNLEYLVSKQFGNLEYLVLNRFDPIMIEDYCRQLQVFRRELEARERCEFS